MLEKIVVVRHGSYNISNLTDEGRRDVTRLAESLAMHLNGSTVALLSSPTRRARETSEILASYLEGIQFEEHECLYPNGYCPWSEQAAEALRPVEKKGADHKVVILSTHMEFIDDFPTFWGKQKGFHIQEGHDTPKGSARMINVQTGTISYFGSGPRD